MAGELSFPAGLGGLRIFWVEGRRGTLYVIFWYFYTRKRLNAQRQNGKDWVLVGGAAWLATSANSFSSLPIAVLA